MNNLDPLKNMFESIDPNPDIDRSEEESEERIVLLPLNAESIEILLGSKLESEKCTTIDGNTVKRESIKYLIMGCIGHVLAPQKNDEGIPPYKGQCSICGRHCCEIHLFDCAGNGCDRQICPSCGFQREERYFCRRHYYRDLWLRILRGFLSPFYSF